MIRRLKISQFKSIDDELSVDLTELTVVTGANSSGKSTLLQALLLLAQTVLHAGTDRHLVLNGPLARLGDFDQVLHEQSSVRRLALGIEVAPEFTVGSDSDPKHQLLERSRRPVLVALDCGFTDKPLHKGSAAETASFPLLRDVEVRSFFRLDESAHQEARLSVKRHPWTAKRRAEREGLEDLPGPIFDTLAWKVDVDAESLTELKQRESSLPILGAAFDHFLPTALSTRTELNREITRVIIDYILQRRGSRTVVAEDFYVYGVLWAAIREALPTTYDGPTDDTEVRARHIRTWLEAQPPNQRRLFSKRLSDDRERLIEASAASAEPSYWVDRVVLPSRVQRGISVLHDELSKLRYLGPLRTQPAPIYPVATTLGSQDVGPSGEWTASVLDEHQNQMVEYLSPAAVSVGELQGEMETAPLLDAVNRWLQYLGVSSSVKTVDRGSLGHELNVRSETGESLLPLTHVGVGVSQCLPVVVSLLLAPEGSLTLLEQPELHLHPAVQSRLADFLLAMSFSGRQCLVETHSEYLINRLRLRTAQSEDSKSLVEKVSIYSAELQDGRTSFQGIPVNAFGAIEDWPPGFFDQSTREAEEIISAALRKRGRRSS